jgi:succinate dehydrogenase hydrophobic anchor subunit
MRALVLIVLAFALLAFDIMHNDGEWSRTAAAWADEVMRDIRDAV